MGLTRPHSVTQDRVDSLQQLRTISDIIVATIVIMAIELTISWNHISGVNKLDAAAQYIPLIVSAAYFLRSIYVWLSGPAPDDDHHHDADFPFFDGGGSGGSYTYHTASDGGTRNRHRRHTVYVQVGPANEWAGGGGRRRDSHHHHHHRRARRGEQMGYGPGEPVMSTAYSRRATMADVPDEGLPAAEPVPVQPAPVHENA